jgi:LemA protein
MHGLRNLPLACFSKSKSRPLQLQHRRHSTILGSDYCEGWQMSIGAIIFLVILLIIAVYGVTLYNGLVELKHAVAKHLANIDVLLRQRHDELPKLVETCKQYMGYEQETLQKVISARQQVATAQTSGNIRELGKAETGLRRELGQLFALAESYPELKANDTFQHLQQRISGLENAIADRRETYNEAVNNNNVRIEQFPDLILARAFNFKSFQMLEFTESETADINVKSLFTSA